MQTFLPYKDFIQTAKVLDYRRLGKQRVEALQIHNIITGKQKTNGWVNHPAVNMWRGYPEALALYHDSMIHEWVARGYKNSMAYLSPKASQSGVFYPNVDYRLPSGHHRLSEGKATIQLPSWVSDQALHQQYKTLLLQKDYQFYKAFWPTPINYKEHEFIWPNSV